MTNYSQSVLKSNGLHHSKNLPEKLGFSPIDTPANTAKKLPSQRCFKPLFIASFNFFHKRLTFAFTGESEHTRLRSKSCTQQLTRRNGGRPSLGHSAALCCQRNCHWKNKGNDRWIEDCEDKGSSSTISNCSIYLTPSLFKGNCRFLWWLLIFAD